MTSITMKIFLKFFFLCVLMSGMAACDRHASYETTTSINAVIPGAYAMVDFSRDIRCKFSGDDEYRFYSSSDYGGRGIYAQLDKNDVPLLVLLGVDDEGSVNISFFSFKETTREDYEAINMLFKQHFSIAMPSYEILSGADMPSAEMIQMFRETGANARQSYQKQNCSE